MILKEKCKKCGREGALVTTIKLNSTTNIVVYACGHTEHRKVEVESEAAPETTPTVEPTSEIVNFPSLDGSMKTWDYQSEGVKFINSTNLRCLIADATGLGKTIQALVAIRENRLQVTPTLILVKSSLQYQWMEECYKWYGNSPLSVYVIQDQKTFVKGFDVYIMSMDLFARMKKPVLDRFGQLNFKCVVLDESHNYKNPDSSRARNLITFLQDNSIEHILALSATPIKNRADEYFTILNILDPARFSSRERFRRDWLEQNSKYAWDRINPFRLERFKELTKSYILRREKHEVLKDLPPLSRDYVYVEIEDENLKNIYNKELDLFANFLNDKTGMVQSTQLLGWLAKLRAITGQAKCAAAIEYAQEFIDSNEEQLTIGINHVSVRDTIKYHLQGTGYAAQSLSGEDSAWHKSRIMQAFYAEEFKILILNMKSGGEGLNIQNCANAVVLERAWNAADEEQFEGRFHRNGQKNAVNVKYFLARGTIDEFFHRMVQHKRNVMGETLVKNWTFTSDEGSIRELSEKVVQNKL